MTSEERERLYYDLAAMDTEKRVLVFLAFYRNEIDSIPEDEMAAINHLINRAEDEHRLGQLYHEINYVNGIYQSIESIVAKHMEEKPS